jgi:hypothetical protein
MGFLLAVAIDYLQTLSKQDCNIEAKLKGLYGGLEHCSRPH